MLMSTKTAGWWDLAWLELVMPGVDLASGRRVLVRRRTPQTVSLDSVEGVEGLAVHRRALSRLPHGNHFDARVT